MEKQTNNAPPKLVVRRVINAKRDRVFAAWSKPELMSQWFIGGDGTAKVTNDFRVGGSYQNIMTLKPSADGRQGCGTPSSSNERVHFGTYLEISPPEKIVFTWNSQVVEDSRVTIQLRDLGDSTELTLTHELLETEELRQGHSRGWDVCISNLAQYLE